MLQRTSVIERAIELATTGDYRDAYEVRRALKREGYESVDAHISHSLARQVGVICRANAKRAESQ